MEAQLTLPIKTQTGAATGQMAELDADVFGMEPNEHAMHMAVKLMLANGRQGTHKTKDRSEVVGTTKKMYKQKGTGNARHGAPRAGIFRHGGNFHGPKPRDYGFKLNRKIKQLARRSALSVKLREQAITVLDTLTFPEPQTREFSTMLEQLTLAGKKVLLVTPSPVTITEPLPVRATKVLGKYRKPVVRKRVEDRFKNAYLSGRNLPKVSFTHPHELNTHDILNAEHVVLLKESLDYVNQHFKN